MTLLSIAIYTGIVAILFTVLEFALKKTDAVLISFLKNWVGTFFIFSAVVKLVDPVGFSIKLSDYFDVFNTPFMHPVALPLSFFLLALEFVLGVALLFNAAKNWVYPTLIALILFFTALTGISAIFNVVQDCGCFGDFLKISPWASFSKDIVLTIVIFIVYANRKKLKPYFTSNIGKFAVVGLATIAALAFSLHNYFHLPIWDFRPYKIGTHIPEQMKQIKAPVYRSELIYKNKQTGEEKTFVNQTPQDADNWQFVTMNQKLVEEGIEAPIHDFTLTNNIGDDLTEQILSFEKPIALIVVPNVSKAGDKGVKKLKAIMDYSNTTNSFNYAFISASADDDVEAYKEKHGFKGTNLSADETMLKTMIRSNPGLVVLKEGTILGKWHYGDIPKPKEVLNGK